MTDAEPSLFVGRTRESTRIRRELEAGHNLVMTGPYGIGRTALVRHVARALMPERTFVHLDGSLPPAQLLRRLRLTPLATALPRGAKRGPAPARREAIAPVLVLDDIGSLTRQRIGFFHELRMTCAFPIIAIVERFLPSDDLARLRTALYPAPLLTLCPLTMSVAETFFVAWARRRHLAWTAGHVRGLALASHGYPLGMWEAVNPSSVVGAGNRIDVPVTKL